MTAAKFYVVLLFTSFTLYPSVRVAKTDYVFVYDFPFPAGTFILAMAG